MSLTDTKNILEPEKWVDNYADYFFNYTISRVNETDIANDLIQETFLAGLKSMDNFKGNSSEKTWLTSILKHKIIDYYRKINSNKGQAEIKIDFYHQDGENEGKWIEEKVPHTWNESVEQDIENDELKKQLDNCIDKLPKKYGMVFRMKTIEGFDTEDICNELQITSSNLWVMVHRARTQLRECLEKNWFNK